MVNVGLSWSSMFTPTLAMVNVGLSWSSMVGIALAASGAGLYFLRSFRPGLARDHDIFFAAVSLLCGGILFFQGWRQDPILQFGQFLLAGSAIFFAVESIRLRGVATEQAKRTTPVVDDERPVSRVYRAELDELDALDEQRPITRRIRGTRDARSSQSDDYSEEGRRRPSSSRGTRGRLGPGDSYGGDASSDRPSRRRRPTSPDRSSTGVDPDEYWRDSSDDTPSRSTTSRPSSRGSDESTSRPRRPRPPQDRPRRRPPSDQSASEYSSSDYVDYQPINYSDEDRDNLNNFE